ncbi:MAG: QueT transporter family protein [Clostridia bacterium]|nr:QueT transporter family protein [Clostridia bacterium]
MRNTLRAGAPAPFHLALAGIVAALYAALTLLFAPISFGPVQFRVSEALTPLPILFPQAIPGLTLGCLAANLIGSQTPWDVAFGTLATFLAALCTRVLRRNIWLATFSPVAINGLMVGLILHFTVAWPLPLAVGSVLLGEAAVVYALGIPLLTALGKLRLFAGEENLLFAKNKTVR